LPITVAFNGKVALVQNLGSTAEALDVSLQIFCLAFMPAARIGMRSGTPLRLVDD
jgi:hypothetical protein